MCKKKTRIHSCISRHRVFVELKKHIAQKHPKITYSKKLCNELKRLDWQKKDIKTLKSVHDC
jgi:hypothetical protein